MFGIYPTFVTDCSEYATVRASARTVVHHPMARVLETAKRQKSTSPGEDICHGMARMYSSKW